MTYDQLSKAVKAGKIGRVYFFYGPEVYIRDRALALIRQKLLPPGLESLNQTVMEGDVSVGAISEAAQTLPMMGDRRLIVLKDWLPLKNSQSSPEPEEIASLIASVPDTCCLVIIGSDAPDKRRKAVQALMDGAEAVEFSYLSGSDLHKYCLNHIQPKTIDFTALEQLIFMRGKSLTALMAELDKLADYIGERSEITSEDVDAMAAPSPEMDVFKMIDLLMQGRQAQAHALKRSMLENGEKPAGLIALLIHQMRMLTHIRLMREKGVTLSEAQQKLELNSYAASRAATQAARFSSAALEEGYRAAVQADYDFKSGRVREEAALDDLMMRLGRMK